MARHRRVIDADYYEDDDQDEIVRNRSTRDNSSRGEVRDRRQRSQARDNRNAGASDKNNNMPDLSNIDMNQIAGLLQNVDLNQLSSIFSSLSGGNKKGDSGGFGDLVSGLGNLGGLGGLAANLGNLGGIGGILSGLAGGLGNNNPVEESVSRGAAIPYMGDRRIELLNAVRPMVNPQRASLIDMIIQLYTISRILKR